MFKYYIKIVPTIMVDALNNMFLTNQFSVTKHEKVMESMHGGSGMPGIFFSYDISALMVKIVAKNVPITHLITDLCSIIGGVWVFAMFVDSVFYRSSKLLNKIELGKAS
ncbi:ERGIC and golgi 3 [Nesidiocoris tenuis]|nr:ERGIC and golgi 3 [Nesidiocoris tenuis]